MDKEQIAQIVHDFMKLKTKFLAFFPKELADLRNRLDEMPPEGEAHPHYKYELFYRISGIIYQKGNLTMGELSSALAVPLSTATRMVDWLVSNGYAARLSDPEDRRIVRVNLTQKGQELHEMTEKYILEHVNKVLSGLTNKEQTILLSLLRKAVSSLKDME